MITVDIWSDIQCPFCYIGKRKFEAGLEKFEHKDKVEVNWHSFQLDATLKPDANTNIYEYLAERKGQTREWAVQMHKQVTAAATQVGLTYNFDKTIVANSFDAHRLIQLAKKHGVGDQAEERLFKAYFTEGKNIADQNTLQQLGVEIGLDAVEINQALTGDAYKDEVLLDEFKAQSLQVRGVPFFVFNNQYAVSGAQSPEIFLQALQEAWKAYEKETALVSITNEEDNTCSIDGNCN